MANNVLPLRAGELLRVYVVARRWRRGFWTVVATLVVERVLDGLAVTLMLGVLVFVIPVPAVLEWAGIGLFAVDVVAIGALVVLVAAPASSRRALIRLASRAPSLAARLGDVLDRFIGGLAGLRSHARLLPLLTWSLLVWIVPALSGWTMLYAMNVSLPWVAAWTILAFTGLGITIPSAPGYIGVFHAAAALALTIFGVSHVTAVGYAVVFHASQYVPITLVGWLFLLREQLSLTSGRALRLETDGSPVSS
jgi:uncharacterized protein (TIRG00374 family)